jgi:protein SCO1/2
MTNQPTAGSRKTLTALLLLSAVGLTASDQAAAAPPGSPWDRDYFPNVPLVNQDGKTLHFYDDLIKDKVVAINFMYESCQDACPLETAKLRQAQEALGDRVGRDIFFYSISIDPEHDTPEKLKSYADKFKAGAGWQFFTGKEEDITLLRKKLGLYQEILPGERRDHVASLIVGNEATGRWKKRSAFDNPKMLARVLGQEMFNYATVPASQKSYGEVPTTVALDPGEDLFRRRCQVCHTVGAGDTVGPDLLGVVAKREAGWLQRWIKEPDAMLAEQDPLATALFAQYKQLSMPNLRLSDQIGRAHV